MSENKKITDPFESYEAHYQDEKLKDACTKSGINCIVEAAFNPKAVKPQKHLEQQYNYLENFTGNNFNSKLEFDTVKHMADKYNFSYEKMLDAYTENFYPACIFAGLDDDTIHNLYIAIMELLAYKKATDNIAADTIGEISDMIAAQEFNPDEYMTKTQYHVPDVIKELNYVYENSNPYDRADPATYYSNVANRIHFYYGEQAEKNKNVFVEKSKEKENSKYYDIELPNIIDKMISFLFGTLGDLVKTIIIEATNKLKTFKNKQTETQNSYKYSLDTNNLEFVGQEARTKLYCYIEKTHQYWKNDWLNCFTRDGIQNFYNSNSDYDLKKRYLDEFKDNYSINPDTLPQQIDFDSPDTTINKENSVININNNLSYSDFNKFDFRTEVQKIMTETFDNFAQTKGFTKLS